MVFVVWKHLELLLDSVDKLDMVMYRLASSQTLKEIVCVPHYISIWHHGNPQDKLILYHNVAGIFSEVFNLVNYSRIF